MYYQNGNLDKTGAFVTLLNGTLPDGDASLGNIFSSFDQAIRNAHPEVPPAKINGALNNAHGDWYEWFLACSAWNAYITGGTPYLALLLPNVTSLDIANLYQDDVSSIINDLRQKITERTAVRLITSNPDFVIVDTRGLALNFDRNSAFTSLDADKITFLNTAYTQLLNKCSFTDLVAFASVKTSFRPDRRLQIPHEGSLMKAIYTHIQTRKWIIDAPGLKYYAFAREVGPADYEALKTVATHSITTVQSEPQAAVDEVFEVDSIGRSLEIFSTILRSTV